MVEISDAMGWDSGPVKRELKLLQWSQDPTGNGRMNDDVLGATPLIEQ